MSHGYTRNTDDLIPTHIERYGNMGLFTSLRRCPECGYPMRTNGKGRFLCLRCEYRDEQDVSGLEDLAYNAPRSDNAFMYGKRAQG